MAGPQTPAAGNGPRRPRAWFARRMAAVLSAVAALGLGGLMYWNDHQPATAQAATASSTSGSTGSNTSDTANSRATRSGDDGGGSIVDDITSLIPGVSNNSSSSSSSSSSSNTGSSSAGSSTRTPVPVPHTNTRGS